MRTSRPIQGQVPGTRLLRTKLTLPHGQEATGGKWMLGVIAMSVLVLVSSASGDAASPTSRPPGAIAQAPSAPQPAPAANATVSQPISVQAGTGVLLRLPQPAATVMSAEPSVARVQPASPTSLFLMGVAPGRTTVIATTDAGVAIVQYDVTVTPGAGAAAPAGATAAAAIGISTATARAIQATISRTVQGASAVEVRAAGNDVILTGTVPNAIAAQQSEAIARGYIGEKSNVINNLTVLGAIQVNVRLRIAEINRSVTRQLGFNWQALGNGPGWRFGPGQARLRPPLFHRCCR